MVKLIKSDACQVNRSKARKRKEYGAYDVFRHRANRGSCTALKRHLLQVPGS
ncbi:MAG: hypothetical protein PUF41_11765 [Prevotella copri]|nr:hypothetical protein [Segatella copri]